MRTAAVLTFALTLAWMAGAQEPAAPKGHDGKLTAADTNKDGQVSFEELSAARPGFTQEKFKRMDRNADGFLSPADRAPKTTQEPAPKPTKKASKEAAKGNKQDLSARLKALDKDADGRVTQEEFKAGFPKASPERFAQLDQNKDGALTPADAPNKAKPEKGGDARRAMAARLLKADTNGDGKVTFEEASATKPGFPRADFDRFDTNKDGALTKADAPSRNDGQAQRDGVMQKLRAADTNSDARVSWEEAQAAVPNFTRERFDRLDHNKDGFIAKDDRVKQP